MSFSHCFRAHRYSHLESLESRTLLAADLSVALVGDTLEIEGDDSGFLIAVEQTDANSFFVEALLASDFSTLFTDEVNDVNNIDIRTGNGDDEVIVFFNAIEGDVDINTGGGFDLVDVSGINLPDDIVSENPIGGDLSINTGSGGGFTSVGLVDVSDDLVILSGSGADDLFLFEVGVADDTMIVTGAGDDNVLIQSSFAPRGFGDQLLIATDGDDDVVTLDDVDVGDLGIFTGGNNDSIALNGVHVSGNTLILTGSGEDGVEIVASNLNPLRNSEFGGLVVVHLGAGDDSVSIVDAQFDSHVFLIGGSGTDDLEVVDAAFDGLFFENLET